MIPLKLQLKNFISYGADIQTIDFSTYPLICLSGKNGHGKSALLDAITWALWGQARKVTGNAKADQGLVRLGQTQMMVCLDFEFNAQRYRARREFAITYGKPYASLDFGLLNDDDHFIPLTDKTISLTQAKIEHTLNLSYESFTNSAFLRQGQANEFSKKSPKERKEILATILGLNQYDTIRKLAMEKMRQASVQKTTLQALSATIETELQKKEQITKDVQTITTTINAIEKEYISLHALKQQYAADYAQFLENDKNAQILRYKYQQIAEKELHDQQTMRASLAQWRMIHKQQIAAPNIKKLEEQKQQYLQQIQVYQTQLQKGLELKEKGLKYKEQLQQLTQQHVATFTAQIQQQIITLQLLEAQKQAAAKKNEDLKQQATMIESGEKQLHQEKTLLVKNHQEYTKTTHNFDALEKQFERRKEYYQKFIEQGKWLTTEIENLEQKKLLAITDQDPSCPLCEQNLSAARKRFLKQKLTEQEHEIRKKLQRITSVVKRLKVILIDQHKLCQAHKQLREQLSIITTKISELDKQTAKIEQEKINIRSQIQQIELQIKETQANIILEQKNLEHVQKTAQDTSKNAAIEQVQNTIKHLEQEIATVTYDAQLHTKTTEQLKEIENIIRHYHHLQHEIAAQDQRGITISTLCTALKVTKKTKQDCLLALKNFDTLETQKKHLATQAHTIQENEKKLINEKELALQEKAKLTTQLAALTTLATEYASQQKTIETLNEALFDYQAIIQATGKDGIQALLIEDAIPEIEHEANYLLSRLTNNQAQIFIESLRDLKKGGTKETLDIKISDAQGIRPYELFSGGEAFRIDFALRIAISKLLARRSGTSLQTLIIDEGFGSQDEDGLSLIMDALYKIQDDFAKIIIVSHLSSMKDQFPVHFVIEKGPQGSQVAISELG